MTKAELHAQIDAMTEEEAAEAKLIFAPDWHSKATAIGEIRKRSGTTPLSPEDFERHFGSLPTDGEGYRWRARARVRALRFALSMRS
ncbi:MAG TPA: hypothetical protein VHI77_09485 [Solirubrobacterales bacterium]|jgi:hypothetical protein|nr:hypothetical protein [Solirubrobacterales bacterium]